MKQVQVEAVRQAFALHQAGELERAASCYQEILAADPSCAEAWHLFGALALQKGEAPAAVERLGRAVACEKNNAQYRYNYAVALQAADRVQDAARELRRAHKLDPASFDVLNNLGLVERELGRLEDAARSLRKAVEQAPTNALGYNNLALVLAAQGEPAQAEEVLRRAIALKPDYAEAYNNLGTVLRKQHRDEDAAAAFRRALSIRPDYASALSNLAGTLHVAGQAEEAAARYRQLLDLQPGNAVARHLLNAIEGRTADTAPADYVAQLFDGYASHFESHLVGALGYHAPTVMRQVWDGLAPALPDGEFVVVDLGCGTGLCAQAFADLQATLVGVDLSERMIAEATATGLYDRVVKDDAVEFLRRADPGIGLALAGDMMIYLGNAQPLLALAGKLAPGGTFICSIEGTDEPGFLLRDTGRFAHNPNDLDAAARAAGLEPVARQPCAIRQGTDGRPIDGFVMAFVRPDAAD